MQDAAQTNESFLTEGIRLMFFSTIAFSLANIFVKQVGHLPAMEIVFFRCLAGVVFCGIGLKRANAGWRGTNRKMLFLRGMFGTTALYLFFLTVQNIPLAQASTIQYLSPIFTTIIAIFLLKESVKPLQWIFYGLAFLGVLLIERFDPRVSLLFLAFGIVSAFCSGVAYNLVRSLREREHPLTVVMHFQLVGVIAGGIFTLFNWRVPVGIDWLYLLLIGAASQLGQWFLTNSLQKEKAASVAIINYSGLIYALAFGWFVFGEAQTLESLLGMILVVCGVILSIIYSKRQRDVEKVESTAG